MTANSPQAYFTLWMSGFRRTRPDEEFQRVVPTSDAELLPIERMLLTVSWRPTLRRLRRVAAPNRHFAIFSQEDGWMVLAAGETSDRHRRRISTVVSAACKDLSLMGQYAAPLHMYAATLASRPDPTSEQLSLDESSSEMSRKIPLDEILVDPPALRAGSALLERIARAIDAGLVIRSAATDAFGHLDPQLLVGTAAELARLLAENARPRAHYDVRTGAVHWLDSTLGVSHANAVDARDAAAVSTEDRFIEAINLLEILLDRVEAQDRRIADLTTEIRRLQVRVHEYARDKRRLKLPPWE